MNGRAKRLGNTLIVALGAVVLLPAAAVTILILASALWGGMWSLGHGGPLFLISIPAVLVGTVILLIGLKLKGN